MSSKLLKAGVAAATAYVGFKYLDAKHMISSDIELLSKLIPLRSEIANHFKTGYNVTEMWHAVLAKYPKKVSMIFEEKEYTFEQVEALSNQVSHFLLQEGLKPGDTAALLMENRPEFVITWLGMTKIGVRAALINTSIKNQSLLHCIKISGSKVLVFGSELSDSVEAIMTDLTEDLKIKPFASGGPCDFATHIDMLMEKMPKTPCDPSLRNGINMGDVFGYIYTSGTTGLPKAAVILHQKMYAFGAFMARGFQVSDQDTIYTCLPLFHSAGGGLGIGMMMYTGATVVIKTKFSASVWWQDCIKHKVTVAQYIGELCRYLMNQAPIPEEKNHQVRIMIGNGLRPEYWADFQSRFAIPEIGEFYGSTEGNSALLNHCRTPDAQGACGRLGTLAMKLLGIRIVKFDIEEEVPIRNAEGRCIDCEVGEPGEMLFIIDPSNPSTKFAGYSDPKATEKKILRNAFQDGDLYFRTGDLLSRDEKGYFHFVDRIGDTFRWKGENCSTMEIQQVLSTYPNISELNVYGVQVPGNLDGRAPMAAVTLKEGHVSDFDFDGFAKYAVQNLPSYSVPLFLRMMAEMDTTATMKFQKVRFKEEAMFHDKVNEPLYWMHPEQKTYVPFMPQDLQTIVGQKSKL